MIQEQIDVIVAEQRLARALMRSKKMVMDDGSEVELRTEGECVYSVVDKTVKMLVINSMPVSDVDITHLKIKELICR